MVDLFVNFLLIHFQYQIDDNLMQSYLTAVTIGPKREELLIQNYIVTRP